MRVSPAALFHPDHGRLASLDVFSFERSADPDAGAGDRRHRPISMAGLVGGPWVFKMLQEVFFDDHAAILAILDRVLVLVVIVLVGSAAPALHLLGVCGCRIS